MNSLDPAQKVEQIRNQISQASLPQDVVARLEVELSRYASLSSAIEHAAEADKVLFYINFVLSLPWNRLNDDILDLHRAKQILDKNHYGLEDVKERILEYLAILILNKRKGKVFQGGGILLVGLVGSGKTSLAYSVAEVLNRPLVRLPFGGLGSPQQLRGETRIKPDAQPGLIIKALAQAKVRNPVILLDELDRVVAEARADIMGVLVELLDPQQNFAFLDHYLDIPFDLSQVLFIATANNTTNIATAVLDRLELIEMPFYSDSQKIIIGKQYLLPRNLEEAGLDPNSVVIDENLWSEIVRPLGYDGGIRSLNRTIEKIVRKAAKQVVEGYQSQIRITMQNLAEYIR